MTMATERQNAANRRNALKSSGPKTSTGKRRASANSYRHGLSLQADDGQSSDEIEALAQRIIGGFADQSILQYARSAARAHLDLVRVRQINVDIINWVFKFGAVEPRSSPLSLLAGEIRYLNLHPLEWSKWVDAAGPIPSVRGGTRRRGGAATATGITQVVPIRGPSPRDQVQRHSRNISEDV